MTNEILFKGKSVSTREWIYSMTVSKGTIKRKRHLLYMEIDSDLYNQIIPGTLTQFTGITIGENKVFFGDLVKDNSTGKIFEVVWNSGRLSIEPLGQDNEYYNFYYPNFEYIGHKSDFQNF